MINVLIVEDDPMVAFINEQYLKNIGQMNVVGPVYKEDEIMSLVKDDKIDLILMDIFLPEKKGIDILKRIREENYLVDVIIISAVNNGEDLKKAFAYGVIDYLIKPFQFERFEEAINKFKSKHELLDNASSLNQDDIDKMYSNSAEEAEYLPKGLNKLTLEKLISFLKSNGDRVWTLREIASEIQISNVTIKKYMDYLEASNRVYVDSTCGNIGRPELKYTLIK